MARLTLENKFSPFVPAPNRRAGTDVNNPDIVSLIIIIVLFLLSLTAAVILFAFFKSTAVVTSKRYQAGGAIAGFIIVFGLLHLSFVKVAGYENKIKGLQDTITKKTTKITNLETEITGYQAFTKVHDVSGRVDPYSDKTKVALVLSEADLPINRKFRLSAPCLDLKNSRTALYIIQEGRQHLYEIFPDQDLSALDIKLPD